MLAGAAVAAPVAIFLLSGCGSDEPAAAQAPALNVTVSAGDGRFVTDRHGTLRLLLRGVNPRVEVADVSPGNSRTWAPTWLWARSWKRLYADYQPNTTVTWGAGRAKGRTSVALVHGRYVKGNLVFEVRPLAPGAKTPLPSVAAPRQTRDLGPVDMYVDPPIPLPAAAWASQELTTAAGLQISSTPWNAGTSRPIVPVLLNALYPPNQPTPAQCLAIGQAIARAVNAFPGNARVGVVASGGLSHFVVDEDLDQAVIQAVTRKDHAALAALPGVAHDTATALITRLTGVAPDPARLSGAIDSAMASRG